MKKSYLNEVAIRLLSKSNFKYNKSKSFWLVNDSELPIKYMISLTLLSKPDQVIISGVNLSVFSLPFTKWCKSNDIQTNGKDPVWTYGIKLKNLISIESLCINTDSEILGNVNDSVLAIEAAILNAKNTHFDLETCIQLNEKRSRTLGKNTKILNDLINFRDDNNSW